MSVFFISIKFSTQLEEIQFWNYNVLVLPTAKLPQIQILVFTLSHMRNIALKKGYFFGWDYKMPVWKFEKIYWWRVWKETSFMSPYLVVRWLLVMLLAAIISTFKWVKITKCHWNGLQNASINPLILPKCKWRQL